MLDACKVAFFNNISRSRHFTYKPILLLNEKLESGTNHFYSVEKIIFLLGKKSARGKNEITSRRVNGASYVIGLTY